MNKKFFLLFFLLLAATGLCRAQGGQLISSTCMADGVEYGTNLPVPTASTLTFTTVNGEITGYWAVSAETADGRNVVIAKSDENMPSAGFVLESDQDFYDFIDMKVEIRNVEDVTQLAVEQWDEYEEVPYIYEVENFREGYFMANLDPECSTTLSLLSVIGRHLCRSNAIFLPASLNQEQDVTFNIEQEQIAISGLSDEEARNRLISFSIASYPSSTVIAEGIVNYNSYVDISQLSPGNYILSIRKEGRILGITKFTK